MNISDNCVASFHYTLTDKDGKVLDSSDGREPLAYLHGASNIIPGLEKELVGKQVGDKLKVDVPAAEAYGERNDEMMQELPANMFTGVEKIEVGMEFHAQTEQGTQVVSIAAVDGDTVTVDANHPLAGVDLTFDVEITEVREATSEEQEHGHAHGAGGHEH
ncbi:peptidylprolyl isomerase [Gilvimarinus sp. SDUM040013]|uniref:Peptidyl-prolyl cis-trans isomerase n=1 Tax=Gilvimarinus gilvus TaxID=3058038 RepID=A0ABU4RYX0_9GAMM|nr:peptidylprolyl isomerase [Gilvimarinus sp. SDUM040013]MDO3384559.1 peptidylprolyl isomerase [Gilvimarinus sp. SDUM040013]MDX6850105.1 peptidylprolyl isomerase [Gilvimarinus sp. SDUM040013]